MFERNEQLEKRLGGHFVQATKYGDEAAMGVVLEYALRALTVQVSRWCNKKGHSRGYVEIVVNATLLKALAKAGTFNPEKALMPWLTTIARHELTDLRRIEERLDRRLASLDGMKVLPSHDENELNKVRRRDILEPPDELVRREDDANRRQQHQLLKAAILSLPELKRRVIEAYCAEKPIGLIAVELGIKPANVSKVLFGAKQELRRRIA